MTIPSSRRGPANQGPRRHVAAVKAMALPIDAEPNSDPPMDLVQARVHRARMLMFQGWAAVAALKRSMRPRPLVQPYDSPTVQLSAVPEDCMIETTCEAAETLFNMAGTLLDPAALFDAERTEWDEAYGVELPS